MSFLHPALLAGLGLVAIPVILHLWLKPRPKKLPFPALRLLQSRQRQNSRRLKLRHLWLLLLRMSVIALMVLAVTRPTLPPANYALNTRETLVTLAILALAIGGYFGVMYSWRQRPWPRHLWLTRRTMLRGGIGTGTLLLLLLGVAWPYQRRVAAEITSPRLHASTELPVMAVYLFDTSPSMQYQFQNRNRLDVARELAGTHLGRLPAGSKVAVSDTSSLTPTVFSADLTAAQNRLDGLKVQAIHRPLDDRVRSAMLALEHDRKKILSDQSHVAETLQQDRFLREIYLFTDLSQSGWRAEAGALKDEIAARPWLGIYLVDVGVDSPTNVSLSDLKLSREAVSEGGQLFLDATLRNLGDVPAEQTVELLLHSDVGGTIQAGKQTVPLAQAGETQLKFALDRVQGRFQQGELKLVGADPLSIDDSVFFTVRVLPPRKVLVVADREAEVTLWLEVLRSLDQGKRTAFETKFVPTSRLAQTALESFDVVCLINASRPEAAAWENLRSFADAGGGLFVALGAKSLHAGDGKSGIDQVAYNTDAAQAVLPGTLKVQSKFTNAATLDLREKVHPLLARFDEFGAIADMSATEFRRYWNVTPDANAAVVAAYAGDANPPALLERPVGRGRVLMLTTAVNSTAWNDLTMGWTYLVWVDQLTEYLSAASAGRSNWTIGAPVMLRIDPLNQDRACLLRMPDLKQLPQEIPKLADSLTLRDLPAPGHYELVTGDKHAPVVAACSLNLPAEESLLTKLTTAQLDQLLGEQRYTVNRALDDLARNVQAGRLGQEVYSLVLAVLILAFVFEQLVSTWFYRTDEAAAADAPRPPAVAKSPLVASAAASRG